MGLLAGAARVVGSLAGRLQHVGHQRHTSKVTARGARQPRRAVHKSSGALFSHGSGYEQVGTRSRATLHVPAALGQVESLTEQPVLEVRDATLEQQDKVKIIFGRLIAVTQYVEGAVVDLVDFQRLVSDAADAGLFGVWPFRGSNSSTANIVTAMYYLPDIIHASHHMQRFNEVFPYLDQLFSTASAGSLQPNHSQCLHEALTLLAEAHDLATTSGETQLGIRRIMGQWSIMKCPTGNPLVVWSTQPQPSRVCSDKKEVVLWIAGALQQQRPASSDCSPAAAMQLISVLPTALAEPADAPQGLYTAAAVRSIVDKAVEDAVQKAVQETKIDEGKKLKVLVADRPNSRWSIRNYMEAKTLFYNRNFNNDMLLQKQERLFWQKELEKRKSIDVMFLTSIMNSIDEDASKDAQS